MKKVLSFFLSLVLLLTVCCGAGMEASAATKRTRAEAVAWLNSRLWQKPRDMDGQYGAQCVDFIQEYYQFLGVSGGGGNANAYAYNTLPGGFQRIQNYYMFVPEPGDIAVWSKGYGGEAFGHVGVVLSADLYSLTVADVWGSEYQNPNQKVRQTTYQDYGSTWGQVFWGVIRPDFADKPAESMTSASITAGDYALQCQGNYLHASADWNGGGTALREKSGKADQLFTISKNGNGYTLQALGSSSGRVLNVYTAGTSQAGDEVMLYDRTNDASQTWIFEAKGDAYLLHPADNTALSLTEKGSSWSAAVEKTTGAANQLWKLVPKTDYEENESPVDPDPTPENSFIDVPNGAYFTNAVNWAVDHGITAGTSKTTFSPNAICTRAQAVTFLWRAAGSPEPAGSTNKFVDVAAGQYYSKAVQWAVEEGITGGVSNDRFAPDEKCTRAQIVCFMFRMQKSPTVTGVSPFVDVPPSLYYSNAVAWAVEQGITAGTSATTFSPHNDCSRGQIVTFLYRFFA